MIKVFLLGIIRDKVLQVIFLSGLLFLLLAPFISMFSMRQVQQLLVTVSLSWISLSLLVLSLLLGSSSVWRDLDRRWLFAVFGLPVERSSYVFSRVCAVFISLFSAGLFLGIIGAALILLVGPEYSTALQFSWLNYFYAVLFDITKFMLLATVAICFSTVATSLFLPLFGTMGIYLAGSASQGVLDYLTSIASPSVSGFSLLAAKCLYYLLPNFSLFDLSTQAVYGLEISRSQLVYTGLYFVVYSGMMICLAVVGLNRRELK